MTSDGRPTRPLLLFYRGDPPEMAEALAWAEERLQDGLIDLVESSQTRFDEYKDGPEAWCTVAVHLNYPPYPWLTEAQLGMEMGRYFDAVELTDWTDPTQTKAGAFTYRFYRSKHEADNCTSVTETDAELCDKCRRRLNLRKNEDIFLSKFNVVLCAECYSKHYGIEVYW